MNISIVILAAGQGTRMRSDLPKVLHPIGGRPLLEHVINTSRMFDRADLHVVYGHGGDRVKGAFEDYKGIDWVHQEEQLGTGHAVLQAMNHGIDEERIVLVLYGDVPLIRHETLQHLVSDAGNDELALLTVNLAAPSGYGRIVRCDSGEVRRIVEEKDASEEEKKLCEVNTGFMAVRARFLRKWLDTLDNSNAQGEYYLTDIIEKAVSGGVNVRTVQPATADEVLGVNDRIQLEYLERVYQRRQAERLMREGVSLADAGRIDIRGMISSGRDCFIDANVLLQGTVSIGSRVRIGSNCVIRDSVIGDDVEVLPNCVIENGHIGSQSRIGPFARIRPETEIGERAHIGNFVEIKKSSVGNASKVNHLSYIGDSEIGRDVNIGAGVITCNYDGANKHRTIIEDEVFVGSDCQLVAPVRIGHGATIGAGSTITREVPGSDLTLSRSKQRTITGWERPKKKSGK